MTKVSVRVLKIAAGLAGCVAVSWASGAAAQTKNYELYPRERFDLPETRYKPFVPERAQENMEPQGGRIGSFLVLPSAELSTIYDSNIFATSSNEESDIILRLMPRVRVQSSLASPLRLNFEATGVAQRYTDNSSEDAEGYLLSHDGSLDLPALGQQSYINWGIANARDWQDRGLPDDANNGTEPTIIHNTLGYVGFQYKPGALSISPGFSARYTDYDDVSALGGGIINNDDRDRWTYMQNLRVGYELTRGYEAYIRGTLNQRRYENTPDDGGINRDSDGYEAVVGAKLGISEITNLDIFAGYISQSYDDARLTNVEGVGFGGQLNWSPRREWNIAASVSRSVQEANLDDYASYLNTTYAVQADYQLVPNLRFDARLSYMTFDFESSSLATSDRTDEMLMAQVGMRYYVTPNYYMRLQYMQTAYSSDVPNSDYDRSTVYLTLGAQY